MWRARQSTPEHTMPNVESRTEKKSTRPTKTVAKTDTREKHLTAAPMRAHRAGSFVWLELRTPDLERAFDFYAHVVGWTKSEMPMGDFTYTMLHAGDAPIGGLLPTDDAHASFLSYLSVDDVDARMKQCARVGAVVVEHAFDVPTVGRMAVVKTPDGAPLSLFKSESGDDDERLRAGAPSWFEYWSTDVKSALRFFADGLSQEGVSMDMGGAPYHVVHAPGVQATGKEGGVFGVMPAPEGVTSRIVPYVQVDDIDAAIARALAHDGVVLVPALDIIDVGRIAVLCDPQGGTFGLHQPPVR
jgi:predicted enzyme related to lactoylglutathione lyase